MPDDFVSANVQPTYGDQATGAGGFVVRLSQTFELLLKEWKFFLPSLDLTANIVRLNREFGEDFDDRREQRVLEREGLTSAMPVDLDHSDEPGFFQRIAGEVSKILFHGTAETSKEMSHPAAVDYYSKFVSERIYNHLAMLGRSDHTKQGGKFSIRQELSFGIAGRIGLDLYLNPQSPEKLRQETAKNLNELGYEFQHWLVETKKGVYPTTWGVVCVPELARRVISEGLEAHPLILEADVERKEEVRAAPFAANSFSG